MSLLTGLDYWTDLFATLDSPSRVAIYIILLVKRYLLLSNATNSFQVAGLINITKNWSFDTNGTPYWTRTALGGNYCSSENTERLPHPPLRLPGTSVDP